MKTLAGVYCRTMDKPVSEATKDLFLRCFHWKRPEEEWAWRYEPGPYGLFAVQAFEGESLVSHYGGYPVTFSVEGKDIASSQVCDVMTAPTHRDEGTFDRTYCHYIETVREMGCSFMYGFTAQQAKRHHCRLPVRALRKKIGKSWFPKRLFFNCRLWDRFPESVSSIDERCRGEYPCFIRRKADYLNWRYADSTVRKYFCFTVEAGGDEGFLVFSVEGDTARVVDFLAPLALVEDLPRMIDGILARWFGKCRFVEMWHSAHSPVYPHLARAGFEPVPLQVPLFISLIILRPEVFPGQPAEAWIDRHFYYTMGDSDLF
ncbi:MAG TPA: GNAT family N-acetyltransferase [Verrucomicrobiae bacterium]|nr:GNAT family N-acetyltransferase [Verrucomicrobiae bacterium]